MSQRISAMLAVAFGFGLVPGTGAHAAGSPLGVWLNDTGRGAIEIKECGAKLCGHVVWLRDASDVKGCGRQIIGEASKVSDTLWDSGWIYSPEKKRKYDVELKPLADGTLRVKGYAGTKLFSRTMIWKPAPADLKRCGETSAAAEPKPEATPAAKVAATEPTAPAAGATPAAPPAAPVVKAPAVSVPAAPEAKAEAKPEPKVEEKAAMEPPVAKDAEGQTGDVVASEEEDTGGAKEGLNIGKLADRLAEIERETGYGLKKSDDGNCRLKVPFATVRFRCDD